MHLCPATIINDHNCVDEKGMIAEGAPDLQLLTRRTDKEHNKLASWLAQQKQAFN